MKIGMNLLLWTDEMTPRGLEICARLAEMGFDSVELPGYNHDYSNFQRWGKELDTLGVLRTAAVVRGEADNPASVDSAVRRRGIENNKRSIECLAAAGCQAMVGPFHSAIGCFSGSPASSDEWKYAVDSMKQTAEHAEKYGLDLCLEPLNRFECYLINCSQQLRKFIDEVNHPRCKALYDTFHAHIEEKSVCGAIHLLGDKIGQVHISENDRSTPGQGAVRWEETFAALHEVNYNGLYVIEAFGSALPNLAAATKIWRRMYEDEFQLAADGLNFIRQFQK